MLDRRFPWQGYVLLALGALAAAGVFLSRAVLVDPTAERIVSAVAFAVIGGFWLVLGYFSRHAS